MVIQRLILKQTIGNSLVVQWLRLTVVTSVGPASIPGWGTKIPQALWHSQNPKQNKKQTLMQHCNPTLLQYFFFFFKRAGYYLN